ncbi:hypothetical protein [Actinomyces vulturis]|nr:hypothetical protein [Actinomyces vulturis]
MTRSRVTQSLLIFSVLSVAYGVWMYLEKERVERAQWAEVTDPIS